MEYKNIAYKIETPRLIIRCYKLEDTEAIAEVANNNKEHLLEFMPWAQELPKSVENQYERVVSCIGKFFLNQDFTYVVFLKSTGELIGSVGLHTRRGNGILEIGYWIAKEHTKKGFATELSYALTKAAFNCFGVQKVEIRCDALNKISAKVPLKLEFLHEATLIQNTFNTQNERDTDFVFSMFVESFKEKESYEPIIVFNTPDALI